MKVLVGFATEEERCEECEAVMAAYRSEGFEYVYDEFRKLCLKYGSHYSPEVCLHALATYKASQRGGLQVERCRTTLIAYLGGDGVSESSK